MTVADINQAMADALGVQLQGTSTVGFTLRVRAGRLPLLTVHRHIFDRGQITPMTERLELRPVDETQDQPLDLDAMAEQARRRVARAIDASAELHLSQMGIRRRMSIRIEADPALIKEAMAKAKDEINRAFRDRLGALSAC